MRLENGSAEGRRHAAIVGEQKANCQKFLSKNWLVQTSQK